MDRSGPRYGSVSRKPAALVITILLLLAITFPVWGFGIADYTEVTLHATETTRGDIPDGASVMSVDDAGLTDAERRILKEAIDDEYVVRRGRHDPRSFPDALDGVLVAMDLPPFDDIPKGGHQYEETTYIQYHGAYYRVTVTYYDSYA